uniref:Band 4.1 C-terminal domain-containing protein n=1 Tax=Periophthalmus magnuspinnatus TaxID=409849 RepID=A0A3B4BFJ1_9GOBI
EEEPPQEEEEPESIGVEPEEVWQSPPTQRKPDSGLGSGLVLSSQTFTSETAVSTATTHITKMVKGGVSQTRIEKRIVISGASEIDQDQAVAEVLSETRRLHPDLDLTRVVVHKETGFGPDHLTEP